MAGAAARLAAPAAILLVLGAVLVGLLRGEENPLASSPPETTAVSPRTGEKAETGDESPAAGPPMQATTPAEVRSVLRYCRTARAEDKDHLLRMALESGNPLVAGNAIRTLGRLNELPEDEKLTSLLRDPRLRVRQDAVQALGQSGAPRAVELLAPLLDKNDPQVRPLVIQALGRVGCAKAKRLIESVLADTRATHTERVFARTALRECR